MSNPIEMQKIYRQKSLIILEVTKIISSIKHILGQDPYVFCEDPLIHTTPTINVRVSTYDLARESAEIFNRSIINDKKIRNISKTSVCIDGDHILFGFEAWLKAEDILNFSLNKFYFEVKFHANEAFYFGDNYSPIGKTYNQKSSTELLRIHRYEEINSANLAALSEIILSEFNVIHSGSPISTNIVSGLHKAGIHSLGGVQDLISGEPLALFKEFTIPGGPIMTSLTSLYMFCLSVRHPNADIWKEIFPRSIDRPILMSSGFATGLTRKHGSAEFSRFVTKHNFKVVN